MNRADMRELESWINTHPTAATRLLIVLALLVATLSILLGRITPVPACESYTYSLPTTPAPCKP